MIRTVASELNDDLQEINNKKKKTSIIIKLDLSFIC